MLAVVSNVSISPIGKAPNPNPRQTSEMLGTDDSTDDPATKKKRRRHKRRQLRAMLKRKQQKEAAIVAAAKDMGLLPGVLVTARARARAQARAAAVERANGIYNAIDGSLSTALWMREVGPRGI